jgi:hypothetical protein
MTREMARGRRTEGNATTITIRLTKADLARIRAVALAQDRTLSAVCRRLILRGLPAEEARERDL